MNKTIFNSNEETKKSGGKWFFFPMSILFHAVLVASIVVVPLISAGDGLPAITITKVFTTAPQAPPPVPKAPPEGRPIGNRNPHKPKIKPVKPVPSGRLISPDIIPDEIPEEEIEFGANNYGHGIGVPGGEAGPYEGESVSTLMVNEIQASPQRISHVRRPRLIQRVAPNYPTTARRAHVQGPVIIEAVTDIYGKVVTAKAVSGHPLLKNAAIVAVKKWVYEPYIINGIPKPVVFTVSVIFKLSN
ncbi:MAG: energy transducer TonB [bacterium]|nr:energy transducer TonB [bacterium]